IEEDILADSLAEPAPLNITPDILLDEIDLTSGLAEEPIPISMLPLAAPVSPVSPVAPVAIDECPLDLDEEANLFAVSAPAQVADPENSFALPVANTGEDLLDIDAHSLDATPLTPAPLKTREDLLAALSATDTVGEYTEDLLDLVDSHAGAPQPAAPGFIQAPPVPRPLAPLALDEEDPLETPAFGMAPPAFGRLTEPDNLDLRDLRADAPVQPQSDFAMAPAPAPPAVDAEWSEEPVHDFVPAPLPTPEPYLPLVKVPVTLVGADGAFAEARHQSTEHGGPAIRRTRIIPDAPEPDTALARRAPAGTTPSLTLSGLPQNVRDEFRQLRFSIMQAAETQRLQVLVVSAVEPGDGASFVARNLALALAEFEEQRVGLFEVTDGPAFGTSGGGEQEKYQLALCRTAVPNLREIAGTQGEITLQDLLRNCDTRAMMEMLRPRFEFVLIDAPAISANPETSLLATLADGIILVAQQDETKCHALTAARASLQSSRANILGVVLNKRRK
ncbi:MAG: hypothetical protein ACKV2V_25845, partial [Blastocatellia bacterium]